MGTVDGGRFGPGLAGAVDASKAAVFAPSAQLRHGLAYFAHCSGTHELPSFALRSALPFTCRNPHCLYDIWHARGAQKKRSSGSRTGSIRFGATRNDGIAQTTPQKRIWIHRRVLTIAVIAFVPPSDPESRLRFVGHGRQKIVKHIAQTVPHVNAPVKF
jgi:hypothetical protein